MRTLLSLMGGLLLLVAGCRAVAGPSPTVASLSSQEICPTPEGTAVRGTAVAQTAIHLTIVDPDGQPVRDVTVELQVDDGPWQSLPERVSRPTSIDGGAGHYRLRASRPGYEPASGEVTVVTQPPPACDVVAQSLTLLLSPTPCPTPPEPVRVTLVAPAPPDGLRVTARPPGRGRSELACVGEDDGRCAAWELPLAGPGQYTIGVDGLPAAGEMQVIDDRVAYTYTPFTIRLAHEGREARIAGAGARQVTIEMPVSLDEINCPLVERQQLVHTVTPDRSAASDQVEIWLEAGLTITDLSHEACQQPPALIPVPHRVLPPPGARLSTLHVEYLSASGWTAADCRLAAGVYRCTAFLPNPLVGRPYAVRALLDGVVHTGTQLPFTNLCYLFNVADP